MVCVIGVYTPSSAVTEHAVRCKDWKTPKSSSAQYLIASLSVQTATMFVFWKRSFIIMQLSGIQRSFLSAGTCCIAPISSSAGLVWGVRFVSLRLHSHPWALRSISVRGLWKREKSSNEIEKSPVLVCLCCGSAWSWRLALLVSVRCSSVLLSFQDCKGSSREGERLAGVALDSPFRRTD